MWHGGVYVFLCIAVYKVGSSWNDESFSLWCCLDFMRVKVATAEVSDDDECVCGVRKIGEKVEEAQHKPCSWWGEKAKSEGVKWPGDEYVHIHIYFSTGTNLYLTTVTMRSFRHISKRSHDMMIQELASKKCTLKYTFVSQCLQGQYNSILLNTIVKRKL